MDSSEECYFCGKNLINDKPLTDWILIKGTIDTLSKHTFAICESCGDSKQDDVCALCEDNFQPYETIYIYENELQTCQHCQSIVEKIKCLF